MSGGRSPFSYDTQFQKECGLDDDGIVGKNTATKLVAVQNDTWFTRPEYYPLKKELMEYSTYPAMGSNEPAKEASLFEQFPVNTAMQATLRLGTKMHVSV